MGWEKIPGWTDAHLHAIYDQAVAEAKDGDYMVEIGVAFGRSLAYAATIIERSGKKIGIVGIDPFRVTQWLEPEFTARIQASAGDPFLACDAELTTHLTQAELRHLGLEVSTSHEAAARRAHLGRFYSFVFVDGDHSSDAVRVDIAAWSGLVKPGGILAGHDHTPSHPGVEIAVREAFGNDYEQRGSCWFRRMP